MSDRLIITLREHSQFRLEDVMRILNAISGVSSPRRYIGSDNDELVEADYTFRGETRDVRLVSGRETVSIHGNDDVSLAFAIEFSKRFAQLSNATLQLFNMGYYFHQVLSPDLDLAALKRRIAEDPFGGAETSVEIRPS